MKHKKLWIFLIILMNVALIAGGVWFFHWRASLPPAGQVRITLLKFAESEGGGRKLSRITAVTDKGKEVNLPYFDCWFEDAEFLGATQYGAISLNHVVSGGVYDVQLGKKGLIVCRYLIDGEEKELPVGEDSCLLYTQEGNTLKLSYMEQPESIRQLWADLRGGTGTTVTGWE